MPFSICFSFLKVERAGTMSVCVFFFFIFFKDNQGEDGYNVDRFGLWMASSIKGLGTLDMHEFTY